MKRKLCCVVFILFCQVLYADYRKNMAAGNAAYKKGNLEQALKFYEQALEKQPSEQLFAFTDRIRKKIDEQKQKEKSAVASPDKTALIALDIALAGLAVAAYLDYAAGSNAYEALYASINNTTPENYRILVNEKAQVESRGTYMAIAAGIAGAAVLYTLADILFLNAGSPQALKAGINPEREYAGISMEWRF